MQPITQGTTNEQNILFLVTGMTPNHHRKPFGRWPAINNDSPWLPDEIHVMSTQDDLIQIKDRLLAKGNFARATGRLPTARYSL